MRGFGLPVKSTEPSPRSVGSCFRLLSTTDPRTVQREVLGLRVFIGFKVQESKAEGSAFADTGSKAPGVWTDLEFRSVLNKDFCCTSAAEIHVKRALLVQVFGLQGCEASEVVLSPQGPCVTMVHTEVV